MKNYAAIMIVGLGLGALLATFIGCGDLFNVTAPITIDDHHGVLPTPTVTPTPTPTPQPCFPTGAPCGGNTECCSLNCTGGVCQ